MNGGCFVALFTRDDVWAVGSAHDIDKALVATVPEMISMRGFISND